MAIMNRKDKPKILIVDDLDINVRILENIIQGEGYEAICALSVKEALDAISLKKPDLILSDLSMPGMDGMEFIELLKKNPKTREIPFIFVTVADAGETKKAAFEAGAVDYIPKPYERTEVIVRINNQLENYFAKQEIEEHNRMMHKVVFEQRRRMEREQENLLVALVKVVEKRNLEMGRHLERVGFNARILAQSLLLAGEFEDVINDEYVEMISVAAKLHDVGTLVLSDRMIETERINHATNDSGYIPLHTTAGTQLLEDIGSEGMMSGFLEMAIDVTKFHHANYDGTGYPDGIKGREIPLSARITAVVNDYDVLITKHFGEENFKEAAMEEISRGSGTIYDPDVVNMFRKIKKQLRIPSDVL